MRKKGVIKCKVDGCEKLYEGLGWCSLHYSRYIRHGDPLIKTKVLKKRGVIKCKVDGCEKLYSCLGWCSLHYSRHKRNGDLLLHRGKKKIKCKIQGCDRYDSATGLCNKHHHSQYYQKNKKRLNKQSKLNYKNNPEPKKAYARKYQKINSKKCAVQSSVYYQKHKKEIRVKQKIYSQTPKAKRSHLISTQKALKKIVSKMDMTTKEWRACMYATKQVILLDRPHECVACPPGTKHNGKDLRPHHILFRSCYPEFSLRPDNIWLMCEEHHVEIHTTAIWGKKCD